MHRLARVLCLTIFTLVVQDASSCTCLDYTLDCSESDLISFVFSDLCTHDVSVLVLRHNSLAAFPENLSQSIIDVDISWNALTEFPLESQLSGNTTTLDVSWNSIEATQEEPLDLPSLEELRADGNRLSTLSFLPNPCSLRVLHLASNSIVNFQHNLARCGNLRELDLSNNPLAALPARAFANQTLLEELRLRSCRLSNLSRDVFSALQKLRHLDLSSNELDSVPTSAISSLILLEHINLSGNRIKIVPGAPFARLTRLQVIYLSNNGLLVLPQDVFSNLTNLETLEIDSNRIYSLPQGIFSSLVNLQRLVLSNNHLLPVAVRQFATLKNLRTLYVDFNAVRSLPSQAFSANPRLLILNAHSNLMSSLADDALTGLLELRILDLHNNSLDALSPALFVDLVSLRHLDVSRNRLQTLPGVIFTRLPALETFDASRNRLHTLPTLHACCAPPRNTFLHDNELSVPSYQELHAWVLPHAAGPSEVLLDMTGQHFRPAALRNAIWLSPRPNGSDLISPVLHDLLVDDGIVLFVDSNDCSCGGLRRESSVVRFCVDVRCAAGVPGVPENWIFEVLRSRGA